MKLFTVAGLLGMLGLAVACQSPFVNAPPPRGVEIRLTLSEPSLQTVPGGSRLLLETASSLVVTVKEAGKLVEQQTVSLSGRRTVSLTFSLVPLKTYSIDAQARDAGGVLRFAGSATVTPESVQTAGLYLLPVFSENNQTGWPVLQPTPELQPAGSNVRQGLTVAAGTSTSFLVDFGTAASAFSLQDPGSDLQVFVQDASTGKALNVDATTRSFSRPSDSGRAWLTYYAPTADQSLSTLGRFTIPAKSLVLDGPLAMGPSTSATFTIKSVSPANATESASADFDWTSSAPDVLAIAFNEKGDLIATAGSATGKATLTARSKLGGGSAAVDVTVRPTTGVTLSIRAQQTIVAAESGTASVYNSSNGDSSQPDHQLKVSFTDTDLVELWYDVDEGYSPGHLKAPDDNLEAIIIDATGGATGLHTLRVQAKFADGHFAALLVPFQVVERGAATGLFQLSLSPRFLTEVKDLSFEDDWDRFWGKNDTKIQIGVVSPVLPSNYNPAYTILRATLAGSTQTILSPSSNQVVEFSTSGLLPGRYVLTLELWGGATATSRQSLGSQSIGLYFSGGAE